MRVSAIKLGDVSRTAISTLRCRAMESEKNEPLIHDPMASYCVQRLREMASEEERTLLFDRRFSPALSNYIALRARKYDALAAAFIARHPGCLVVNLGCGFDTRYWRIDHHQCEYIELDLPEVMDLKRLVLSERLEYDLVGTSVLDHAWMERVNPRGDRETMLLAEGLLMYLPRSKVIELFGAIARAFRCSRMVCEVATEKYTRGLWKRIVEVKFNHQLGFAAGASYRFGIGTAREIESWGSGLQVVDEWSYVDDPDARPRFLKYLGVSRTQWTVVVSVHE
jgi:methyltransferase (TIGR00027 family)